MGFAGSSFSQVKGYTYEFSDCTNHRVSDEYAVDEADVLAGDGDRRDRNALAARSGRARGG